MATHGAPTGIDAFVELLQQHAPRPLSIPEMARMLQLLRYDRREIRASLEDLVIRRTLRRIGKTRYQWMREIERQPRGERAPTVDGVRTRKGHGRVEGRYSRVRAGFGFVEVLGRAAKQFHRDILIPAGMEGAALHGDRVEVEIVRRDPRVRRVVGRVTAVTGAVHQQIIGTLEQDRRGGWRLVPQNDLLPAVDVVGDEQPRARDEGLIALVRLTRQASRGRNLAGELVRILGSADDPDVQFFSIAYEHGLRIEFPPEVAAQAEELPAEPDEADFSGREDLRALPFVTIDGETARDFDDAVCLQREPSPSRGARDRHGYRLWVAIADVSHYVRPGSALDAEAARRGTSVYFPDRAIPMLPERLSNQLCSLNPERDRLVLVAEMTYDRAGHRLDGRFYRALIRSRARLTYGKVAAVLSQADTPQIDVWRAELGSLVEDLQMMHELMGKLYRNRIAAGSLDLDLPEALIDLSEEGRSVGVRLFHRNDAHRIIEELMLEANQAVATYLRDRDLPFPYRIHEPPDPDDVDDLNRFLAPFGFEVEYEREVRPPDVQRLLSQLGGHRLARVLSRQVLRSLTQAQYSTLNAGHFGLAFPIYCHFTSPIRRYPDLLVHRQLGRLLDGEVESARAQAERLEEASVAGSQSEREAMEAERAMLDLKKAEFMLDHLLEPEPGTIVSVVSWGFYVELDAYPIEGLVRIDDLDDDRYTFIEEERSLKGMRTRQRFRLGDRVVVEAVDVSLRRREIDFALLERLASGTTPKAEGRTTQRSRRPVKSKRARGRRR